MPVSGILKAHLKISYLLFGGINPVRQILVSNFYTLLVTGKLLSSYHSYKNCLRL